MEKIAKGFLRRASKKVSQFMTAPRRAENLATQLQRRGTKAIKGSGVPTENYLKAIKDKKFAVKNLSGNQMAGINKGERLYKRSEKMKNKAEAIKGKRDAFKAKAKDVALKGTGAAALLGAGLKADSMANMFTGENKGKKK